MKFSTGFRMLWWLLLVAGLIVLLSFRAKAFVEATTTPFDIVLFLILCALLAAPLFTEISFFGISLKHEFEQLKDKMEGAIDTLRADIKNSIDIRTQFSPHVYVNPPPDAALPTIEERVKGAVASALREMNVTLPAERSEVSVPEQTQYLFSVRYHIEKEMRRIWKQRVLDESEARRPVPMFRMAQALVGVGLLPEKLGHALREVYSICSPAIHGEPTSNAQVAFVRDVAPQVIDALRTIQGKDCQPSPALYVLPAAGKTKVRRNVGSNGGKYGSGYSQGSP